MTAPRRARPPVFRTAAVAGFLTGLAATLSAAGPETVVLKDGFVIQGNVSKEVTSISDPATGAQFPVVKANGLEMIDEGPKVVIFSSHYRRPDAVGPDVKLRPAYKSYAQPKAGRISNHPLPGLMSPRDREAAEFNEHWRRTITVNVPGGFDKIQQMITYMDPYFVYLWSPTHLWRLGYRTSEMEPDKIRRLLQMHPDLVEDKDKPDPVKRIAIAKFMLDVGWVGIAKDDVAAIQRAFPTGLSADAKAAIDALSKEVDAATAGLVIKEADLALKSGRYGYAADVLAVFPEKLADARQTDEATRLMAQLKSTRERYESGRRVLRALLDNVTGRARANPFLAAGGSPAVLAFPARPLQGAVAVLAAAGEDVYAELHPDSASRLVTFVNLAVDAEKEAKQGRDPKKRPDELLAAAVSGWARGDAGATTDPDAAVKLWAAREGVLRFQRTDDLSTRNALLKAFKKENTLKIDELAQVISLLPPARPENLLFRTGTPVPPENGFPPGVYRRKTGPTKLEDGGLSYLVKLPPEYHHGRAYPVLIALTDPHVDVRQTIASLAYETDRRGYIVLAPEWGNQFGKNQEWSWDGKDHEYVTAVLQDAVRHFCVNNDEVFLFGVAEGANMAMDVGISHPDLFAGVTAMGPVPRYAGFFNEYWRNAQKLPFYVVTGEMWTPSMTNLRSIFERWMPFGFPSLMVAYKGRAIEWFGAEIPVMFDWMSRKKRASCKETLNLNVNTRHNWMTMRRTDNRFYWLGADEIREGNLGQPGHGPAVPAAIQGDIAGNNVIHITTRGVTKVSVWLDNELIDWSKPVGVNINRARAQGWKAKVLEPDIEVLLNDYRERGDRRRLFLQHLEFQGDK
jgi:hypothetical protein